MQGMATAKPRGGKQVSTCRFARRPQTVTACVRPGARPFGTGWACCTVVPWGVGVGVWGGGVCVVGGGECVCVCVCVRERESVCVCVCAEKTTCSRLELHPIDKLFISKGSFIVN